jgi:glycosyltransferase involved in cell wall biosynthesis
VTISDPNTISQPLVSVIIPTYNYGALIVETLKSLGRQTLTDWECIVVDDGSTDDTAEIVARFAESERRVRYIWQQNQRQAVARNTGLAAAKGKYVQFLDADDLLEPRKLEFQVKYLESHPGVDIVYGGVRYFTAAGIDENLHSLGDDNLPWMSESSGQGRNMIAALLHKNTMVINASLTRRTVVEQVGPFDERLTPAEDWDYWLRCAVAGKRFQYDNVEDARALVRAHEASSSRNRVLMYNSTLLMRAKFDATNDDAELLAFNREMMVAGEGYLGVEEAVTGNLLKGMRGIFRAAALERRPRWRAKWLLCALAAPFVPKRWLRGMVTTSLTEALGPRRNSRSPETRL